MLSSHGNRPKLTQPSKHSERVLNTFCYLSEEPASGKSRSGSRGYIVCDLPKRLLSDAVNTVANRAAPIFSNTTRKHLQHVRDVEVLEVSAIELVEEHNCPNAVALTFLIMSRVTS